MTSRRTCMMSACAQTLGAASTRILDVGLAAAGLVATAPISAGVALAIRVVMGPPVLFRQVRIGRGGRPFCFTKFRTMRPTAPGEDPLKTEDARRTALGEWLRATSLDELPTLWHVVRGEMSLVGPRPLLPRYMARYSAHQARRHQVRPGLTGPAQIHGRNRLTWEERLDLDVWYVDHRSLLLDIRILGRTLLQLLDPRQVRAEVRASSSEFMG